MKKKIVSVLLAATMLLTLAACGNAEGNGGEIVVSTSTSTVESTSTSVEPEVVEVTKPDHIKIMWDGTVFKEGDNYAFEFYKALAEALGFEESQIEWVRPDHSSYAEQVGIAFTDSDTLADVVILPSNLYASYAQLGNLWDMTEAWNNSEFNNSDRKTSMADSIIAQWYTAGPDGTEGIYGMYPARGNGTVTYIKAVAAEAAGYTEDTLPTTWAEYQDMLIKLTETTGTAAVLAPGLVNKEAPYVNYLPEFYQDAYPEFYQNADGEWVDGFTEQAMIDALSRLNWAYQQGVLDSQIFDKPSTGTVRDFFYTEKGTSVFNYWAGTWAYTIKSKLKSAWTGEVYPDQDAYATAWAMKPIAEVGAYVERLSPMICITSSCKNPEGVFDYFVSKILDGGEIQMLWQYGVEGVHYEWKEDHSAIVGLPTEATKDNEKPSKTSKNLFEANLKIGNFSETDPYTPADAVIDESFNMFDANCTPAYKINSSEVYETYKASLWQEKEALIADATKGVITPEAAIAKYKEDCGDIVEEILLSFNN